MQQRLVKVEDETAGGDGEKKAIQPLVQAQAVKLANDLGVSVGQAAKDLDIHKNVLRRWVREPRGEPQQEFLGNGIQKAQDADIARLRKEVGKFKM